MAKTIIESFKDHVKTLVKKGKSKRQIAIALGVSAQNLDRKLEAKKLDADFWERAKLYFEGLK